MPDTTAAPAAPESPAHAAQVQADLTQLAAVEAQLSADLQPGSVAPHDAALPPDLVEAPAKEETPLDHVPPGTVFEKVRGGWRVILPDGRAVGGADFIGAVMAAFPSGFPE